jgi:hypothetical protein
MDQDMDLTIGSLNFHIGSLGSIRLLDPVSSNPSASEVKTVAMSESSVGSSSEANSSVSFVATEVAEGKIAEVDENMENFDLRDQLEDLMICHGDTSDKSIDTWETGLELHEDDNSVFSSFNSKFDNRYRSTSKVTSYQRCQKQRSWQHKHIYTPRGQVQETQESICVELHCKA